MGLAGEGGGSTLWLIGHPGLKTQVNIAGDRIRVVSIALKQGCECYLGHGMAPKISMLIPDVVVVNKVLLGLNSLHMTVLTNANVRPLAALKGSHLSVSTLCAAS